MRATDKPRYWVEIAYIVMFEDGKASAPCFDRHEADKLCEEFNDWYDKTHSKE